MMMAFVQCRKNSSEIHKNKPVLLISRYAYKVSLRGTNSSARIKVTD